MSLKSILLLGLLTASAFAQSKSAVQFYDTTGATKTGKIGWTGDATTGSMFIQTPQNGILLQTQSGGVVVSGPVTATKFTGDGSSLTNLPAPAAPTVGTVTGLQDSLNTKATNATVTALQSIVYTDTTLLKKKADTSWVLTKIGAAGGGTITGVTAGAGLTGGGNTGTVTVAVAAGGIDSTKIAAGAVTDSKIAGMSYGKLIGTATIANIAGLPDSLKNKADTGWVKTKIAATGTPVTLDSLNVHGTVIQKNGYIGIGTTSPSSPFHVNGASVRIADPSTGSSALHYFDFDPSGGLGSRYIGVSKAGVNNVQLNSNGISYLNGGNVGIGTTTPARVLSVVSSSGTSTGVNIQNTGTTGGNFTLFTTNSGAGIGGNKFTIYDEAASLHRFAIDASGNIGIGTTSPAAKLQVVGDDTAKIIVNSSTRNTSLTLFSGSSGGLDRSIVSSNGMLSLSAYGGTQMTFYSPDNGTTVNAGIGTITPQYALDVNGTIRGSNVSATSDRRYKTDVTPIDSSLSKVSKLQGVYYNWDRAKWPKKNFPKGKQVGLIAQEVEKVIPEVVNTDKEGYKSLSYDKLSALLIEAVKEQQKEIESQKEMILSLKKEVEGLKAGKEK